MKKNIGTVDRLIRLGAGIAFLLIAYWVGGGWLTWFLVASGIFCLYEAAASWCVLYQLLGKNSCPIKK